MTRAVASRTPGLTVDMVDNQMFGLSDALPHVRQKGEIDLRAVARTMSLMTSIFRQPDHAPLTKDQREITEYSVAQPAPESWSTTDPRPPGSARLGSNSRASA